MTASPDPEPGQTCRRYPTHVDVAIVGSGPSGAAYARILSEQAPEATIAVFEVGPTLSNPPGGHVKNIPDDAARARAQRRSEGPSPRLDAQSTNTLDDYASDKARLLRPGTFLLKDGWRYENEDGLPAAAMSSNVGGMAAHWTGACPRPGESERIGYLDGLDDLLTEAERLLMVNSDALADAPLAGEVRSRLSRAFDDDRATDRRIRPMPLAVVVNEDGRATWSGSDVVFGDVTRENPNFSLFDNSLVTRVLVSDGRACGVHVREMESGLEVDVSASFVVVAADSLRTPQVLYASGIRPEALGRYLNDQPQVVFAVRLPADTASEAQDAGGTEIKPISGVTWVPFTDRHPFHGQVMQLDASPVPLDDVAHTGSIVGLGWFCAKDLQASDRVMFSDSRTDDYGMPSMQIRYTLTQKDERAISDAKEAIIRTASALGEPLDPEPLVFPPGASLHYQGSVRMGPSDDGTSVCDANSEVWQVRGLHVAGNGVIPTATACNPTLTSVALAVAGARHIAARLNTLPMTASSTTKEKLCSNEI